MRSESDPESYFGDFTTTSVEETLAIGAKIGKQLTGGEVFLLRGDLGAGKTVFVKGLATGLGIDPTDVTSPTFTLINIHEGRLRLYHIDLYRLESQTNLGLGLEELFDDKSSVIAVEWAERLRVAPARAIPVEMSYISDNERKIIIG